MADRYRLAAGQIRRTATLASAQAALSGRSRIDAQDVRQAMRLLNAQTFDALATCLSCGGDWTHLAAREDTIRELADLELRCRHRERVPPSLGHDAGGSAGCGVRALFRGPSGSGKSLAARLLASVLQKDLYRVDLSSIVNKYIGETEKNLKRVFDAADVSDMVLFFDEADSLFGRRTEVSDAHDRYANLEISYLLERMERFKGLAILATNRKKDLDEAFTRRLRYIVDFPLPDAGERKKIWRQVIPQHADSSQLQVDFLAERFPLAGGSIRSIVFNACLQCADGSQSQSNGGGRLTMPAIIVAVKREYDKMNRALSLEQYGSYSRMVESLDHE
jgi:SpoVK/Ycf46/Vps4 family AAA+-type ATPase